MIEFNIGVTTQRVSVWSLKPGHKHPPPRPPPQLKPSPTHAGPWQAPPPLTTVNLNDWQGTMSAAGMGNVDIYKKTEVGKVCFCSSGHQTNEPGLSFPCLALL